MSEGKHTTVVGNYNFSRRVVDHRVHHDLNYAINKPWYTRAWLGSAKQRYIGTLVHYFGIYMSGSIIVIGGVVIALTGYVRSKKTDGNRGLHWIYNTPRYGENFLLNRNNAQKDTGKWNYLFACYENERNCGRDFDWIRKKSTK